MIQQKDTALTFYGFFTQDGVGDTGLTVTVDVYEGTSGTAIVSAGSATELAGGLYYYTLSSGSVDANAMYITIFKTTDTDTDQKQIPAAFFTPVWADNIDDSIADLATDIATVDTVVDAIKAKTDNLPAAPAATGDIPSAASIADAVLDEATSGHVTAGTLGKAVVDILADTNELQTNQGNWVTATGFSTHSAADVVSAMQAVAADFKADVTGLATAANLATVDTVVDAIKATTDKLDNTLEDDAGTYRFTTNALEQAPTGGSAPTAAAIADAVWDESITGHSTLGTTGRYLSETLSAATTNGSSINTIDTVVDAIKVTTDKLDDTLELDSTVYRFTENALEQAPSGTGASAASIADAVWDEATSGHTTAGTFGKAAADILADTNELQTNQGNWVTATGFSTHSAADVVSAMQAVAADFKADVSALATAANLATVDTVVDAVKVTTDKLDSALELDGAVYRYTTNALEQAPTGGSAPTAVAIRQEIDTNSTQLAAIKVKTDNLPASPAATGDIPTTGQIVTAMQVVAADFKADVSGLSTFDAASDTVTLANGAHGGAAATLVLSDYSDFTGGAASIDYDEVASAVLDATATDYNTAGTIGNKINSAASAGDPWTTDLTGYATDTAGAIIRRMGAALETTNAIITKSASVQELNIRRGDTLPASFSGLGDITGYTDIWFTVKRDPSNADSAAEIQVTGDGLVYLNGTAATAANGSITVSDAAAGDISVSVAAIETAKLAIRSGMYYDLQVKVGGVVSTIAAGRAHVIYDVTKSV